MDIRRPKSHEWRERAARYRAMAQQAGSQVGARAFLEVAEGWEDLANRVAQLEDRERILHETREDDRFERPILARTG
jgi:hypothetical protein